MITKKRWRMLYCFMDEDRDQRANDAIACLKQEGFEAKIWNPLPQHKTSGHVHVVVLCTLEEKVLIGLEIHKKYGNRMDPRIPSLLESLKAIRGF